MMGNLSITDATTLMQLTDDMIDDPDEIPQPKQWSTP